MTVGHVDGPFQGAQFLQDILDRFHKFRAVAYQLVGSAHLRPPHIARKGEDLLAHLPGKPRRNESAAPERRFNHHDPKGERRDNPVSGRKIPRRRRLIRQEFTHQSPAPDDLFGECSVLLRIHLRQPIAQHRNRPAPTFEGALVRRSINTPRQAIHNGESGLCKSKRNPFGLHATVYGSPPRTDNRNRNCIALQKVALYEEEWRRILKHAQRAGITPASERHDFNGEVLGFAELFGWIVLKLAPAQRINHVASQAGFPQCGTARLPHPPPHSKAIQEPPNGYRPKPLNGQRLKQVKRIRFSGMLFAAGG